MKSFLVIGKTATVDRLQKIIQRDHSINCFHALYLYTAVKLLFERHFDVLIVSSKTLHEETIDFISYIDKQFANIKILISMDNGIDSTFCFPDRAQCISEHELKDFLVCPNCS